MRNSLARLIVLASLMASLPGCEPAARSTRRLVIGLVVGAPPSSSGELFAQQIIAGATAEAVAHGATLVALTPPSADAATQIALVRQLGAQSVDAIIIDPMDPTLLAPPLSELDALGIPVLTVHRVIGDGAYGSGSPDDFPRTHVGSNDHDGGRIACDLLAAHTNATGHVYAQTPNPDDERLRGCREVLAEKYPAMQIVATDVTGRNVETATVDVQAALTADPSISAVLCTDVQSGLGVAAAGLSGVHVVSFDPSKETLARLQTVAIDQSLAQKPQSMGSLAVQFALAAIAKKTLPTLIDTGFVVLDNANAGHPEMAAYVY